MRREKLRRRSEAWAETSAWLDSTKPLTSAHLRNARNICGLQPTAPTRVLPVRKRTRRSVRTPQRSTAARFRPLADCSPVEVWPPCGATPLFCAPALRAAVGAEPKSRWIHLRLTGVSELQEWRAKQLRLFPDELTETMEQINR